MNPARREPLLWLQLLGLAALPLEALLLVLLLAGADPGFIPGFERLLTWALGGLAPAVLFWRLPPDLWSLLLLQVPLRGRRPEQLSLSALQTALPLRLLASSGAVLLLPLLWWADANAGLAWAWSPLATSPRLVTLLVSVPVLTLMLWQWHQLVQALWMLSRPAALLQQTLPLTQVRAAEERLNLGLPLLLLAPLAIDAAPETFAPEAVAPEPGPPASAEPEVTSEQTQAAAPEDTLSPTDTEDDEERAQEGDPQADQEADLPAPSDEQQELAIGSAVVDLEAGVAVTPEEPPEEHQGTELDAEVTEGDGLPG